MNGLSNEATNTDSPFMIGLLGVALCLFPPVAAKGATAAKVKAAAKGEGRSKPVRPVRTPAPTKGGRRAPVLDDELPSGASIDEVRALLERSSRN